ncbi:hypothetical protein [Nonomuraea sp. NPDC050783]|uniref:hypothetical protein n=1 Tax=Nonomuraea sp. NPDC050783 TaxID=3154634 RepID=UPI003465EA4E
MKGHIDRSRLKVTSRRQIARSRAERAREREWREVRRFAHLARRARTAMLLIGVAVTVSVGILRGFGILPPLLP